MLVLYGLLHWVFFLDGVFIIPLGLMHFKDDIKSCIFRKPLRLAKWKRRTVYIPVVVEVINIQAQFTAG